MSSLTQIWQRDRERKQIERLGYRVEVVHNARSRMLPKVKPVVRPAASVADILGFRPSGR
jgi:hypothetical protein